MKKPGPKRGWKNWKGGRTEQLHGKFTPDEVKTINGVLDERKMSFSDWCLENAALRSPAPAATETGWRLLEVGEVVMEGDEWLLSAAGNEWIPVNSGMIGVEYNGAGPFRHRLTPPAQGDEMRSQGNSITEKVIELASKHADTWNDKSLDFWYRGLAEEMYELSLAMDFQHEHAPEYELLQISAIAINFIRHLHRSAAAAVRGAGGEGEL